MSDFIQDTWQDLRDKRLWPVALVLVLAIAAIPVLLTKSAAQTPTADSVAGTPQPRERVTVQLDGGDAASTGAGSALDRFAKGDPFTPPAGIAKRRDGAAASASAAGPSAGGDGAAGGGGDSAPGSAPGTPITVPPPVTRTETNAYEYVADVTFWNGERRRAIRGLRKLDMLPSQSAPVLIFMGTSGEGGNAVFLVDSTLKAAGEGQCVPSDANCAYVHVGPGSEHAFSTEEGDSYRLRVDEIRRVKVKPASASSPVARSSVGDGAAIRRFQLPSLVDLVEEISSETVTPTATTTTTAPAPVETTTTPAPVSRVAKNGR